MSAGSRPNVLLVHWSSPPTTGGVESHLADLACGLAGEGCPVVLLTGEADPVVDSRYRTITAPGLDLKTIKASGTGNSAAFRGQLMHTIEQHRIEVIHGHNLHHFDPVPALAIDAVRRQRNLRVFHTFHETWPDLLRDQPIYRSWDANFAVSSHVQEQCRVALGFVPTLFPLGVDVEVFRAHRACFATEGLPVILHPARLLPWKGVDVGLRALRVMLDRGHPAELVITDTQRITDWNEELDRYRATIRQLIGSLELSPFVRFSSAAYRDMPRLYEDADIVIYPTIGEEPYGLVPLEAMSCSRPVVASRSGGILETVVDGETGYIVDRGDHEGLADRLIGLVSNREQARRMGQAGRRRVEEVFASSRYVSRLIEWFNRPAPCLDTGAS